MASDAEIQ